MPCFSPRHCLRRAHEAGPALPRAASAAARPRIGRASADPRSRAMIEARRARRARVDAGRIGASASAPAPTFSAAPGDPGPAARAPVLARRARRA